MDDRNRTQAAMYILQHEKPQLLLIHLADLDAEEHDNAPFRRESKAIVERSDELIGLILSVMPAGSALAGCPITVLNGSILWWIWRYSRRSGVCPLADAIPRGVHSLGEINPA